MENSGSHDFSVITNYQLIEYTERTLYNNRLLEKVDICLLWREKKKVLIFKVSLQD